MVLEKAYSRTRSIVYCPQCEFPKIVNSQNIVTCRQCKFMYRAINNDETNIMTTITAIESIKSDNMGPNDGWAHCPKCKIIISKGAGCDHMRCVCGEEFSWSKSKHNYDPQLKLKCAVIGKIEALPV